MLHKQAEGHLRQCGYSLFSLPLPSLAASLIWGIWQSPICDCIVQSKQNACAKLAGKFLKKGLHITDFNLPLSLNNVFNSPLTPFTKQRFVFFKSSGILHLTQLRLAATTRSSPKWHLHSLKSESMTETTWQPITAQAQQLLKNMERENYSKDWSTDFENKHHAR